MQKQRCGILKLRHSTSNYNICKTFKYVHKKISTGMFTVVLFGVVKIGKQPNCSSIKGRNF